MKNLIVCLWLRYLVHDDIFFVSLNICMCLKGFLGWDLLERDGNYCLDFRRFERYGMEVFQGRGVEGIGNVRLMCGA